MLYLLGGDNNYQSINRLNELKDEFLSESKGIINIVNADELTDATSIISQADTLPLFSKPQLLIIKRMSKAKTVITEKIIRYCKTTKHANIIFWEEKPFDKRTSFYKLIKEKGIVEQFDILSYNQLKTWINSYVKEKNILIDSSSIDDLLLKLGSDQLQLVSTLDNLILLCKKRKRNKISPKDINELVEKTTEESIWELVDSIGTYQKIKALDIIENMLREHKDFPLILSMIARQLRILTSVKYLCDYHHNAAEISSILKLHPFVVRKAIQQSANFSMKKLKKLYEKLFKTDIVVKEGRFDDKLALDLFVAAL
jgi:DNA polymerase-3 subunit delta